MHQDVSLKYQLAVRSPVRPGRTTDPPRVLPSPSANAVLTGLDQLGLTPARRQDSSASHAEPSANDGPKLRSPARGATRRCAVNCGETCSAVTAVFQAVTGAHLAAATVCARAAEGYAAAG
jgi:hypothetical protein